MLVTIGLQRIPVTTELGRQGITIRNETRDNANEHEVHFRLCMIRICFYARYMNDHDMQMLTLYRLGVDKGFKDVLNPQY